MRPLLLFLAAHLLSCQGPIRHTREDAAIAACSLAKHSLLVEHVAVHENFGVRTAVANVSDWGVNYVDINPVAMAELGSRFGFGAMVGVFGHELGHVIDFTYNPEPAHSHIRELRADAWAGCALAGAGISTQGLEQALEHSLAIYETETHPGWEVRVEAVRWGWAACFDMAPIDGAY